MYEFIMISFTNFLKNLQIKKGSNSMATNKELIEYICDQLVEVGLVSYRKMFGEYMIYVDLKPIILVCDNQAYVKILPEISNLLGENALKGTPYPGAKEHYIVDIDNKEKLQILCYKLIEITAVPKPKKKRLK